MLIRIVAVGAVIIGLMLAVKNGRVLRATGLMGSCAIVQTERNGTQLEACRPGKLDGAPDLSGHACTLQFVDGNLAYWQCPAPLATLAGS